MVQKRRSRRLSSPFRLPDTDQPLQGCARREARPWGLLRQGNDRGTFDNYSPLSTKLLDFDFHHISRHKPGVLVVPMDTAELKNATRSNCSATDDVAGAKLGSS